MTTDELHKILDDENYKITPNDLCQIVYDLKRDTWNEYFNESIKEVVNIYDLMFYVGETNAFQIILDLLDHLDVNKYE